jgi:hypothetical protein
MAIRIGVHPVGEKPNQHIIHAASQATCMTTACEVPTKSKSDLYSRDEVLAPSDRPAWSSSWATSFSLQQTTLKQGGTVRENSY